jgi:hypothetical protein
LKAPPIVLIEFATGWDTLNAVATLQLVAFEADEAQAVNAPLPAKLLITISPPNLYLYLNIHVFLLNYFRFGDPRRSI